jgi:hypothetical protein
MEAIVADATEDDRPPPDVTLTDRRRPGRREVYQNPHLIALLRGQPRDIDPAKEPPLLNTTYWLFTKTKLKHPTITLHAEGCPILRHSRQRTLGVLTGPLTWAEIAALPDGYPCGRCKPTPRPLQGPRRRPGKESRNC